MKRVSFFLVLLLFVFWVSNSTLAQEKNLGISVDNFSEIFPVFANLFNEMLKPDIGLIRWKLDNRGNELIIVSLASEIPEWTPPKITTVSMNPNQSEMVMQTPFGTKLLRNYALVPSTLLLRAKIGERVIFEETRNIAIRAADDMVWGLKAPYDTIPLIAAWVTPKDPSVERVLSIAKNNIMDRSLSGYQKQVMPQVRAIYNAVKNGVRVSYVNSPVTFGQLHQAQRVRLPRETISQKAANCIDGAVLFASLFENIGLEPLIIFTQTHAFVGVREASGSNNVIFIETTRVGKTEFFNFENAIKVGSERYKREQNNVKIIDIKKCREKGIYPMW